MLSKNKKGEENIWVSLSDIMTGLMVIFMFIAISYILEVKKEQERRDIIFEEFKATKENLYAELEKEFKDDFAKWEVELDKDLSIKFTNPDVLFELGKANIRRDFAVILNQFLPRYFDVLRQEKYRSRISEIRIEGHTDTVPAPSYDRDPYIGNVRLSQERSAEVLKYFRQMEYYQNLSPEEERKLQFWLTANGLSFGRTLDDSKQLTALSNQPPDNELSRRVEFRIITSSDSLVNTVLKQMENGNL
ncbi:OmpA family protein [Zeaxanthinibacter sp. PT1]|uniref:OmpA/MotB family protein n=1 Tax=Zeaxanthinibacter TaxID=561554 RepID=UPI00234AE940|nr:OmpA family protein [Zeaxanthinibacter sp. PT1]MDC6350466.1 OmpA family protein [Zeaxanthinibacter sp. PT1]